MQSRRHFPPDFKTRVVLDILTGVQSQAEICRKHTLSPNLVALWKTVFLEEAHLAFQLRDPLRGAVRIAELEQNGEVVSARTKDKKKSLDEARLTIGQKRDMLLLFHEQYTITILCEVLGVPLNSAYYHAVPDVLAGAGRPGRVSRSVADLLLSPLDGNAQAARPRGQP